jgi:hypothetical protein
MISASIVSSTSIKSSSLIKCRRSCRTLVCSSKKPTSAHAAGHLDLKRSNQQVVEQQGNTIVLNRLVRPVRQHDFASGKQCVCCRATLLIVRRTSPQVHSPGGSLVVVACNACGRLVGTPGQRCRQHTDAAPFEVWQIRKRPACPPDKADVSSKSAAVMPAGLQKRSSASSQLTDARLLFSCQISEQLSDYLGFEPAGLKLEIVDHWGTHQGTLHDALIRPGTTYTTPPPDPGASTAPWHRYALDTRHCIWSAACWYLNTVTLQLL